MAKSAVSGFQMFGASGADMSQISTTSATSTIKYQDNVGIIVNWSGSSPVGSLAINVSNDGSLWQPLDFGSTISITGNTGDHVITINQLPFTYIQAVYTKVSGTGHIFAALTAKSLSGGAN